MNKSFTIKVFSFLSLDGYRIEAGDCCEALSKYCRSAEGNYDYPTFRDSAGCVVMTGMYYASLQAMDVWPFGDKPCYILTPRSFNPAPGIKADIIIIPEDNPHGYIEAVGLLRGQVGGDIWLAGDQDIITLFMKHRLVDEITLNILPVTLGDGQPFFGSDKRLQDWTLRNHTIYDNGVAGLQYTADRTRSEQ